MPREASLSRNNSDGKFSLNDAESHGKNVFWILSKLKSNQIWIVITLRRLIQHQTEFCLVLNRSKKRNYNPNLFSINKIPKKCLCVHIESIEKDFICFRLIQKEIIKETKIYFPDWYTLT